MNLEAFGSGWKFTAAGERRSGIWQLTDTRRGEIIANWGFARFNGSSETDTLREKCRFHGKLDNREVVVETLNVYPFGGESTIERTFTLRDKLAEIRLDVKPGRGEVIREFELEDITFPGSFKQIALIKNLPATDQEWQLEELAQTSEILYESTEPWAVLLLTDDDGFQIELGTGGDYWRMQGAGDTLWQIIKNADGITVKRRMLKYSPEDNVERRPWRFNYYLCWGKNTARTQISTENCNIFKLDLIKEVQCECFRAPAVRKYLRKIIRQQLDASGDMQLQLPDVKVCDDAGHLERPGKKALKHWDLDELFALYSWGNRQLGEARTLFLQLPEDSLFRKLPSARYIANAPGETMLRES